MKNISTKELEQMKKIAREHADKRSRNNNGDMTNLVKVNIQIDRINFEKLYFCKLIINHTATMAGIKKTNMTRLIEKAIVYYIEYLKKELKFDL